MSKFNDFSIRVKNFKCFGETPNGFENIKPINLIIGRNNSGKSTLLDLIQYATQEDIQVPQALWHANRPPEFIAGMGLTEEIVKSVFSSTTREGGIPGANHLEFGRRLIGARLTWRPNFKPGQQFLDLGPSPDGTKPFDSVTVDKRGYFNSLAKVSRTPLAGMLFRRIYAERNISPEVDAQGNLDINGDGAGATNVIQNFLNKASLPSEFVDSFILNDLNIIFGSDAHFSRIICQQLESSKWEIYLEEDAKGKIPLSQSGSGLKTIILTLAYMHLLPFAEKRELSQFIFGFEELENNLHPSLLRRLLIYLRSRAIKDQCTLFLTTHSRSHFKTWEVG